MLSQCAPAVLPVAAVAIYRFAESPSAWAWFKMVAIIGMTCLSVYQVRCFIRGEPMVRHYGGRLACDDEHKIERMFYAFLYAVMYLVIIYALLAFKLTANL